MITIFYLCRVPLSTVAIRHSLEALRLNYYPAFQPLLLIIQQPYDCYYLFILTLHLFSLLCFSVLLSFCPSVCVCVLHVQSSKSSANAVSCCFLSLST
jgi:hypothetical protein